MKKLLVLLAFIMAFAFSALPVVAVVNVSTLYTLKSVQTISYNYPTSGSRESYPTFATSDGTIVMSYSPGFSSQYMGTSSTGRSWSTGPASILGGPSRSGLAMEGPVYMTSDPTRSGGFVGALMYDVSPSSNCQNDLVYSPTGGTWYVVGWLPQYQPYTYPFDAITTSDGSVILAMAGGSSSFLAYCLYCPAGKDPRVLSNWQEGSQVSGIADSDEPSIVELSPRGTGHLLMIGRGGYSATSTNFGMSWTAGAGIGLTGYNSPVALLRFSWSPSLIMLAYDANPGGGSRTPLEVAVSDNEGLSWGQPMTVADEGSTRNVCYPYLTMVPNSNNVVIGWWSTDVSASGGSGQGEKTMAAVLQSSTGPTGYSLTVNAFDSTNNSAVNVNVQVGGSSPAPTPMSFSGVSGSVQLTLEQTTDSFGNSFRAWSTGETSMTITVSASTSEPVTAYYGQSSGPSLSVNTWLMIGFGVCSVVLVGGLAVARYSLGRPKPRRRRR